MDAVTLHIRGTGGAQFDMDVPAEGTHAREAFLQRLAGGELVALDDDGDPIDRLALLEELAPPPPDDHDVDDDGDELGDLTVNQLRDLADQRGIDLGKARTKRKILEALRTAPDSNADEEE